MLHVAFFLSTAFLSGDLAAGDCRGSVHKSAVSKFLT